jgi:hypothetical protein
MTKIKETFQFGAASNDGNNLLSYSLFRNVNKGENLSDIQQVTSRHCSGCNERGVCNPAITSGLVTMWSGEKVLRVNVDGKQDVSIRREGELGVGCGGIGCGLIYQKSR